MERPVLQKILYLVVYRLRQFPRLRLLARRRWSTLLTAASLVGCALPNSGPSNTASQNEPPTTIVVPGAWNPLAPGLEQRTLRPGGGYAFTTFIVTRIDPAFYTFRAHYRPGEPLDAAGWRAVLPEVTAFINANYFAADGTILGLLVSDGLVYGSAYSDRGGLFQVMGEDVRVRSTITEPYFGEALDQAVQAFPMLVTDGAASFYNTRGDRASRRTVIGQDSEGRILWITTASLFGMTLVDLAAYLASSDLGLVNAINFDGGGSTLLSLSVPGVSPFDVLSFDRVPAVLSISPR